MRFAKWVTTVLSLRLSTPYETIECKAMRGFRVVFANDQRFFIARIADVHEATQFTRGTSGVLIISEKTESGPKDYCLGRVEIDVCVPTGDIESIVDYEIHFRSAEK